VARGKETTGKKQENHPKKRKEKRRQTNGAKMGTIGVKKREGVGVMATPLPWKIGGERREKNQKRA